eukprot:1159553-Pelagomonas_calceolata.AAC.16
MTPHASIIKFACGRVLVWRGALEHGYGNCQELPVQIWRKGFTTMLFFFAEQGAQYIHQEPEHMGRACESCVEMRGSCLSTVLGQLQRRLEGNVLVRVLHTI